LTSKGELGSWIRSLGAVGLEELDEWTFLSSRWFVP